jgi:hypothetical protein
VNGLLSGKREDWRIGFDLTTETEICLKLFCHMGTKGNETALCELGFSNDKKAALKIHILPAQARYFPYAKSESIQERENHRISWSAKGCTGVIDQVVRCRKETFGLGWTE